MRVTRFVEENVFIIIGLGNPGREYAASRHNIGFMTVDMLADKLDADFTKQAHRAVIAQARIGSEQVVLAKPQTFMNLSGFSALDLMQWYKIEHDRLIVVYDDVDLPVGKLRVRANGSAGTHNGMRSIIYQLGYDDFPRVRIGIGKAKEGWELADHVIAAPDEEEAKQLVEVMKQGVDAIEMIIGGRLAQAQEKYNGKKA